MKAVAGVVALVVALVVACSADVRAPEPPDPTMHAIVLGPAAPRQDVALAAFATAPAALVLAIVAIDNPLSQGFSLAAGVTWRGADGAIREAALGTVTPYPATRPGSFQLALPAPARALLARRDGRLSLQLALQPITADRPLAPPLTVTLGEPRWP
jgi:hypothetical protein